MATARAKAQEGHAKRRGAVVLVHVQRGTEHAVGVRSARTGQALFACVGVGPEGHALALLEAIRWATAQGHTLVTAEGKPLRAAA